MVTIYVEDGSGRVYTGAPPLTIGRGNECDLQLTDTEVSRQHLVIHQEGRDYVAEDQKSANGTFLRGPNHKISRAILCSGDSLTVGRTRLRVEIDGEAEEGSERLIRFVIAEPASLARTYTCRRETLTIGRHASCDVVIPHATVSRRHAMVIRTPAGFVINDQSSLNAIMVGRPPEKVTAALVYDGDELRLGDIVLRVEIPGALGRAPDTTPLDPTLTGLPFDLPRPSEAALQERLFPTPLFRGFSDDDWQLFLSKYRTESQMRVERFEAGQTLCEAGTFDLFFCVVLKGHIDAVDPDTPTQAIMSYRRGDFFGLVEAKKALPRAMTLVAVEESLVFYVPRHQIRFLEHNTSARALLAARHKEEAWRAMAATLDLFQGVSPAVIAELVERSEVLFFDKAGLTIVQQGTVGDAFYLVRDGYTQVIQQAEDDTQRVLAYLRPGEFFGEEALLKDRPQRASVVTAGKAELVKIDQQDFSELCARQPEVAERLRKAAEAAAHTQEKITPQLAEQLEKWGQGYVQADALLVMDLELCVKCDLCVSACENLHGESRLIRRGMQLGKYLVPSACRHCDDPVCMFACPTGAITRRLEGEISIDYDLCVGCGACAIACPYDNIKMIETNKFDRAQARKQAVIRDQEFFRPFPERKYSASQGFLQRLGLGRRSKSLNESDTEAAHKPPPLYPIKCDLCHGLPFMGCVHACPTGAAIRVDPRTILKETGAVSVGSRIKKAGSADKG